MLFCTYQLIYLGIQYHKKYTSNSYTLKKNPCPRLLSHLYKDSILKRSLWNIQFLQQNKIAIYCILCHSDLFIWSLYYKNSMTHTFNKAKSLSSATLTSPTSILYGVVAPTGLWYQLCSPLLKQSAYL
jgi:hypothetical protein